MYEITHDKAYLIKAINRSIQLINARGGATAPSPFAWASGWNNTGIASRNTYVPNVPGNILHPMAHLCHLILIDEYSTLCAEALPLSPVNLIPKPGLLYSSDIDIKKNRAMVNINDELKVGITNNVVAEFYSSCWCYHQQAISKCFQPN